MEASKYTTHPDPNIREFAMWAMKQPEAHKYRVVEHLKDEFPEPVEYTFIGHLTLVNLTEEIIESLDANLLCSSFILDGPVPVKLPNMPFCKTFWADSGQLQKLPNLPMAEVIKCARNDIDEIGDLPNCVTLDCRYNSITRITSLPKCKFLFCEHNQLTELPDLPSCLELHCGNNQIKTLPFAPHLTSFGWAEDRTLAFSTNKEKLNGLPERFDLY